MSTVVAKHLTDTAREETVTRPDEDHPARARRACSPSAKREATPDVCWLASVALVALLTQGEGRQQCAGTGGLRAKG
jgi:hypothetical protein